MINAINYIGGQRRMPQSEQVVENRNPANADEIVGKLAVSVESDADLAVQAAYAAFPSWRSAAGPFRGEVLLKAALILERRADELAELLTREMGKTLVEAKAEVLRGAAILKYYSAEGLRANGEQIPPSDGKSLLYTKRTPLGVVALITPWNFPIAIPLWKMAPALIYGNTIVLKPATNAGLTASLLFEVLHEAGFPAGVVNLVLGSGSALGNALIDHPFVQGVSFTGSNGVGRQIAQRASLRGIKYQLEMGGKNAVIVMEDADLEKAADSVISGAMKSSGQKCTATSKVIIVGSIKEQFIQLLMDRISAIRVGNGLEAATYYGPLATSDQQQTVLNHIQQGIAQGARLLCGGDIPKDQQNTKGYYVEPTLFDQVTAEMSLAQDEIFGPVLAVMEAETLDEAITLANKTKYGLSAAVYTRNLEAAMIFVERIEAGMVKVNGETAGVEYQAPFGGLKQSSSHSREQGRAAMEFFTNTQTISISY